MPGELPPQPEVVDAAEAEVREGIGDERDQRTLDGSSFIGRWRTPACIVYDLEGHVGNRPTPEIEPYEVDGPHAE